VIKTTGKTERKPVVDLAKTKLPKNGAMPRKKICEVIHEDLLIYTI
jgi:hypothetical protein